MEKVLCISIASPFEYLKDCFLPLAQSSLYRLKLL